MKKFCLFSIILLSLLRLSYGYDLKGYITRDSTLTIENSPYNVTGDLFINNGAHLTINNGVIINIMSSSYEIFIGTSATSKGALQATNTVFNGYVSDVNADEIFIQYGSTAQLTNCSFNNILLVSNESSPVIENAHFENVTYPLEFINECTPTLGALTFNGVTNKGIKLSGTINTNYTLPNYNLPYFITSSLSVNAGAILEIASGDTIRFASTYDITAGSSTTSRGTINGSNVFFKGYSSTGDQLIFNYGSAGTLYYSLLSDHRLTNIRFLNMMM